MNDDMNNNIEILYNQTCETVRTFLEWRHKVISIYFLAVGGVFILASWMYDHELRAYLSIPFFIEGAISIALAFMDAINARILIYCISEAAACEVLLSISTGTQGIFSRILNGYTENINYTRLLRVVYGGTAIVSLIVAAGLLLCPPK